MDDEVFDFLSFTITKYFILKIWKERKASSMHQINHSKTLRKRHHDFQQQKNKIKEAII